MPKAAKAKSTSVSRSKTTSTTAQAASRSTTSKDVADRTKKKTKKTSTKDPKDSHLYTDDNPSTTLHGTGFKDSEAARRTIDLVSGRSLTYQFQTINTMYFRAQHHPHKTEGIKAAMAIFNEWLKVTYPATKKALRAAGFKPVLSKEIVAAYAPLIRSSTSSSTTTKTDTRFLNLYVDLQKNKRLANILLDDAKPDGKDWEQERYDALCQLVPEGREDAKGWEYDELWSQEGKQPTEMHLALIAWGWSPVPGRTLAGRAKAL